MADAWEIVTEAESPWNDHQRELMLQLVDYEAGICACGFHQSIADDEANLFRIEKRKCPVCAEHDRWDRIQAEADESERAKFGKEPPADRQDPADGRHVGVRLVGRVED
ncbi:hypothetical protein [Microbacterium sp.]|uniref:hypothetical protein n=1 Tax=Microbacterium sp. TaxID=51671 RepID=UPI003735261B